MKSFVVSLPTDRPFISERVEVVRLSNVKTEIMKVADSAKKWRDQSDSRQRRFSRNPRFKAAFNYWLGHRSACDGLLYQIMRIISDEK